MSLSDSPPQSSLLWSLPLPFFFLLPFSFFFLSRRSTQKKSTKASSAQTPLLVEKAASELLQVFDEKVAVRRDGMRIKELWIYPVKSCKGVRVKRSVVEHEGLENDRRWMIVDEENLKACTARQFPKMVLIETSIVGSKLRVSVPEGFGVDEVRTFDVPAKPSPEEMADWDRYSTLNLWSLHLSGSSPPSTYPSSVILSQFFKRPVRMVYKSGKQRGKSKKGPEGCFTAFADTYPLHLLTLSTLTELAHNMASYAEDPVAFDLEAAIQRFRPNVVVEMPDGTEPFVEDGWGRVEIGEGVRREEGETAEEGWGLEVVGRCGRCTMPNVSPLGTRHAALPYRILNSTRPKEVDEFVGVPCPVLGVYAVPSFPYDAKGTRRQMVWREGEAMVVRTEVDRSVVVGEKGKIG